MLEKIVFCHTSNEIICTLNGDGGRLLCAAVERGSCAAGAAPPPPEFFMTAAHALCQFEGAGGKKRSELAPSSSCLHSPAAGLLAHRPWKAPRNPFSTAPPPADRE